MQYKAIIFDLDGTLIYTAPDHRYKLIGQVLSDLGTSTSPQNINRFWFETGRQEIIKQQFNAEPNEFWRLFKIYDTVHLRKRFTMPYDDVIIVKELRENGLKTGIVTGAPMHIAEFEIGMLGRDDYDSIKIAHSTNGIRPKPDPHGLVECMESLGVKSHEAVYVGNSDEDILTARSADVKDIFVDRGEYEFDIVPSIRISSLLELRKILGLG